MVINQTLKACDPAVINGQDAVKLRVTWQEPLTYQNMETLFETTVDTLLNGDKPHLAKGRAIIAYAEALKMPLTDNLHAALEKVDAANPSGTDPELNEIAQLIQMHPKF
jgi:Ca-activated chloride channel homolog